MTAENSYRDFFRNNQTEMKYETKVADCNAQGDTKKFRESKCSSQENQKANKAESEIANRKGIG